jgi:hypothetical protein
MILTYTVYAKATPCGLKTVLKHMCMTHLTLTASDTILVFCIKIKYFLILQAINILK